MNDKISNSKTDNGNTMTGKCIKCNAQIVFGKDGVCKSCLSEICWNCWVAEGRNCPVCGKNGKKK